MNSITRREFLPRGALVAGAVGLGLGLARGEVVDLITEGFESDAALRRILAT